MRRITRILCILLISANAFGQMIPVTNHYVLNPLTINPAFAGSRGVMNIAAFYRNQWVGITGAPTTMSLAMDAPFMEDKLGLGLVIINDRIDIFAIAKFGCGFVADFNSEFLFVARFSGCHCVTFLPTYKAGRGAGLVVVR